MPDNQTTSRRLLEDWLYLETVIAWEKEQGIPTSEDTDRKRWMEIVRAHLVSGTKR